MRWTNSWGRGLNRSAGRAPGHCVLRWGQNVPSFPHTPFLAPVLFLRCASDSFSLTKPNTSCKIEWPASLRSEGVQVHPGMPFGFPSETSVRLRRSPHLLPETRFWETTPRKSACVCEFCLAEGAPDGSQETPFPKVADNPDIRTLPRCVLLHVQVTSSLDQRQVAANPGAPLKSAFLRMSLRGVSGVPKDGLPSIEHFLYTFIRVSSAPIQSQPD